MEFTNTAITGNATVSSNPGISSPVPTTTSYWKSMNSSTFRSTSLYNVSQDSNGTTAVTSGKDLKPPEGCYWHLGEALGYLQTTSVLYVPPQMETYKLLLIMA